MNNEINESNTTYSTKDLVLATYLKLNDAKLASGYDPVNKTWTFFDSASCDQLSLELRNGESKVDILKYEAARRNLLAMVYDNQQPYKLNKG